MIRVLHKAFDMLEYLAKTPRQRKKLNEISGHLKMNAGTCANILKTMVQRKYVDQANVRGGYLLGPMIYYLSRFSAYRGDLVSAAEPLMANLSKQVNETVLLVILRGQERFVILQIDGNQNVQVGRNMFQKDVVYQSATGRLLLAHLNAEEFNEFITKEGLPGSHWPEASSLSKLKSALETIRKQGSVCYKTAHDVVAIAYPIREKDQVIAALGLFLPAFRFKGTHKTAIMKGMSATSSAISEHLHGNEN
ncbi:MAG: IclR family transcriptional regulator [Verrucomicrobia bacterium]|nr:IclR family transcriptional regulator [Verrucomicrobiota bacterium]MBU1734977.1 IclR family transcriptional regulator [Verrucomicrobiota bacterium]MBU1856657.1 IclR family transcriptional regulator [Verrucomicrobiota bacterium]